MRLVCILFVCCLLFYIVGGKFGLFTTVTPYAPVPDFFLAVLYKRLVVTAAFQVEATLAGPSPQPAMGDSSGATLGTAEAQSSVPVLGYAHCAKNTSNGLVFLVLNPTNTSSVVRFRATGASITSSSPLHAYLLTAPGANPLSKVSALNGKPLKLTARGTLPNMDPAVSKGDSLSLPPTSHGFVVFPQANASVCSA